MSDERWSRDCPEAWAKDATIQHVVVLSYEKFASFAPDGKVKSHGHWGSIESDLFDRYQLRINKGSLKKQGPLIHSRWRDDRKDESGVLKPLDQSESETRRLLLDAYPALQREDRGEEMRPTSASPPARPSSSSSSASRSSSPPSASRVKQEKKPIDLELQDLQGISGQLGMLITNASAGNKIAERIAKSLERIAGVLEKDRGSKVAGALARVKVSQGAGSAAARPAMRALGDSDTERDEVDEPEPQDEQSGDDEVMGLGLPGKRGSPRRRSPSREREAKADGGHHARAAPAPAAPAASPGKKRKLGAMLGLAQEVGEHANKKAATAKAKGAGKGAGAKKGSKKANKKGNKKGSGKKSDPVEL